MGDTGTFASNSTPSVRAQSNKSSEVSGLSGRRLTPYEPNSPTTSSQNSRTRVISERGISSDTVCFQRLVAEGRFQSRTPGSALSVQSADDPYAIHFAASNGNAIRIIDLVKNYGVNINMQDELGRTALQTAIMFSKPIITSLLMSMGADTNVQDKDGNTAMHYAIQTGSYKVARELIFHQADMNIKNNSELSPYGMIPYRDDRRFDVFKVNYTSATQIMQIQSFQTSSRPNLKASSFIHNPQHRKNLQNSNDLLLHHSRYLPLRY